MTRVRRRVLVVDDERDMAESCAFFLDRAGYDAALAHSGEDALRELDGGGFDMVITDLKMPRMSGLTLVEKVRAKDPDIEIVVITGHPEVDSAVAAMRYGVLDYITKPFTEEEFLARVDKAAAHGNLKRKNSGLRERLGKGSSGWRMVYRSGVFAEVVETVERAARTDVSVLILGESGTGKEVVAHYLHDASERAGRPFVPVDCTTIPENLVESELFGHKKGAFSGADRDRLGLLQIADKGTLFFDEVGELPLAFQPKLLRAIQERQVRRVGAQRYDHVDVRILAATNADLAAKVRAGTFREDLYYRLDVVRIHVPPLRARPEDIEPLAAHFLTEFAGQVGGVAKELAPDAVAAMRAYAWPGNVRQLRNAVERACALGAGDVVELADLPPEVRGEGLQPVPPGGASETASSAPSEDLAGTFQEMKARQVAAIESTYLENLLRRHGGNVTRSAEEAGVSRSAFQKLMQRYGIKSVDYRG